MRGRRSVAALAALCAVASACTANEEDPASTVPLLLGPPRVSVVAEGLINPLGLAELPGGGILVAEEGTGQNDDSAGVSVITPDGRVGRVVSGLPSGLDAGDLSGAPLVGVSPDGSIGFTAHFGSEALLTFPLVDGTVEPETKDRPALGPDELGRTMVPLNNVSLRNAFDVAFADDGSPVVTDASENGVATSNDDETTRFIHRFGALSDPEKETVKIEAVPTGIARYGDEYLVTLTGGCPFPAGSGEIVAVSEGRVERLVVDGLNMPIDVTVAADGTVWFIEFAEFAVGASCFTGEGYQRGTGRLSRLLPDGTVRSFIEGLDFPGAVLAASDGSLYLSEVYSGRVLRMTWEDPPEDALSGTAWHFTSAAADAGLTFDHGAFRNGLSLDYPAMMGAGLCWLDFDGDGWLDLYLVNSHDVAAIGFWEASGGLPHNQLFRNVGGRFEDVTAASGAGVAMRGNGCVGEDLDGDGLVDLYVTADGPNALFLNNGDGTFTDVAGQAGVAAPEWSTATAVADVDGDGRLDLYVGAYIDLERKIDKPSGAFPQDFLGVNDRLYLNTGTPGAPSFRDVAAEAGLVRADRSLGAIFSDLDADGDVDLYVANDGQPNRLFVNETAEPGSPVLRDATEEAGVGDTGSGMGVAGGDYDLDGSFDLFVTNWEAELNALYRNDGGEGPLAFTYTTHRIGMAGLGNNKTGWGATWADFDHDTDLDLLVAHGRVPVTNLDSDPELVRLYGNRSAEGDAGQLRDWTGRVRLDTVGALLGRGSAVADYDNDGDLDAAVNVIGGRAVLLRNDNPPGRWLQVSLGSGVPGAVVTAVLPDGRTLRREVHSGSSYLSGEDSRVHFGLGESDRIVELTIRWPDGVVESIADVAAGQVYVAERRGGDPD